MMTDPNEIQKVRPQQASVLHIVIAGLLLGLKPLFVMLLAELLKAGVPEESAEYNEALDIAKGVEALAYRLKAL